MLHLPSTALYSRVYIYIPIGLYLFERLLRTMRYAYNNIRPGHATLIHLPGGVTKVVVSTRQLKSWTPGSFVLLSLPRFGVGQSHPATIASIPSSHEGKLVFFLRAHHGFTSKIHANASVVSLSSSGAASPESPLESKTSHLALIDGPYGGKQLDFAAFGTVLLISGSTGVTFTLPILLDISFRAQKQKLCVKEVTFIWAVKTASCIEWAREELRSACDELQKAGVKLSVKFFVTAGEEFVEHEEGTGESSADCRCNGDCSCIVPVSNTSAESSPGTETKILTEEIAKESGSGKQAVDEKSSDEIQPPAYSGRLSAGTTMHAGRPDLRGVISEVHEKVDGRGELGVGVCGPVGLTAETRRVVACLEGKGRGIYLHAESFGW
jgi:ferric-chelate reductase